MEAIVADRFAVDLKAPMPELNTAGGYAFAARDTVDPRQKVYAVVQRLAVPRRELAVSRLKSRNIKGVLCPKGDGIVTANTPEGRGQRLCTIVEFPAGGRLVNESVFPAFSERMIRDQIAPQLARIIDDLDASDVAHRGIMLSNLYYRDRERTEIVLGECFSAPAGYHLPPSCEPLERATALPAGRGEGGLECDMYAFGVAMLSLFLGRDIAAESKGQSALEQRIQLGSFVGSGGAREGTGLVNELLRGLLEDNSDRRWLPNDVINWSDGVITRKGTASDPGWALTKSVVFQNRNFKDRRLLALAFLHAPREAIEFSQSDRFRHWVNGGLPEGLSMEWIDRALDARQFNAGDLGNSVEEAMALARLMAVIYPEGPICFGPLRFMPDSFPMLLSMAFADDDTATLDLIKELMNRGRLNALLEILSGRSASLRTSQSKYNGLTVIANNAALGFGLPRCLYELHKSLPCLSVKVRGSYADSLKKLAIALEESAAQGEAGVAMIDPHVAAYMARQSTSFEPMMARLGSVVGQAEAYVMETLKALGALQEKYCPQPMKKLAQNLSAPLKKLLDPIKSKTRRKQYSQLLGKYIEDGNLFAIANNMNFAAIKQRDDKEYENARRYFSALERERRLLDQPVNFMDPRAQRDGHRYALYISFAGAGILAVSTLFQMLV